MSDETPPVTTEPGVPRSHFEGIVEDILKLRDEGRVILFLRGNGRLRIVFLEHSLSKLFQELPSSLVLTTHQIAETLGEIEEIVSVIFAGQSDIDTIEVLLSRFLDEFTSKDEFDPKIPQHETIAWKVSVAKKLITEALAIRYLRIRSKTLPALEELDAEIVQSRSDRLAATRVSTPFLRLRLRYTDGTGPGEAIPWFLLRNVSTTAKSFEFECDLSDLDLLQHRLDEARAMLLRAQNRSEVEDADAL